MSIAVIVQDAPLNPELEVTTTELFSVYSVKGSAGAAPKKAEEKAPAKAEEDDDMDDLFGSDDDDAAAELAAKMAADAEKAKKKKVPPPGRSLIVLDVKPFDAETDLAQLALNIKKIEHEGIQNWGDEHKLVPVAFGVKKLVISLVVWDDKCGVDDICDMINEKYEDDVQSIDVSAMSKV